MSEYSVKNISKLPMLFPEKRGGLARSLMLKVLAKLQVGSLTLSKSRARRWSLAQRRTPLHLMPRCMFTTLTSIDAFLRAAASRLGKPILKDCGAAPI